MKTKKLVPLLLTAILFIACLNEQFTESEHDFSTTLQEKWNGDKELSGSFYKNQTTLSHYHSDAKKIREILQNRNVVKFRFILGLNYNSEMTIEVAGVDEHGMIIASFQSTFNANNNYQYSINKLQNNSYTYQRLSNSSTHLLPYKTAYTYITEWQKALQSTKIEDIISYRGTRIRYFSLPKQIVAEMVASENVNAIAMFLAVNSKKKLTLVFIQKAHDQSLLLKDENHYIGFLSKQSNSNNDEGNIYDFTEPCPDLCD